MSNKFLGRATIRLNGQVYETAAGAQLDLGGTKRNTIVTGRKVGYAEETAPATITGTTSLMEGQSLEELRNLTDATVIFECDTGQSYVIREAFLTEPPTLKDGAGGEVTINIAGYGAEELAE